GEAGGDARFGPCVPEWLPPPLFGSGLYDPISGVGPYYQGETAADTCGDLQQGINTLRNIDNLTLVCIDTDNDGIVDVGSILSWDNNTANLCTSIAQTVPATTPTSRAAPLPTVVL